MKSEFNWPSSFRGEDVDVDVDVENVDGRQTTDAGVTAILLAHQ